MCKKSTVVYGDCIGKRMVSWCVFNGKDFSFLSDKQVKARLQIKEVVNGLTLDADGNVSIDKEFTPNLMGKSGLTFSPIMAADDDGEEPTLNKYYALVKVTKNKEYCFVTNRCGYETYSEEQVKAMLGIMALGGVQLSPEGELVIHKGVEIEAANVSQSGPQVGTKGKKGGGD